MGDSPSDWPKELGELKTMDTLLRCPICYEFVRTAVSLTRCMHSFCSVCIRRYLSSYQKNCPQCHIGADENELVVNRLLDEQVKLFQSMRNRLLTVVRAGLHALPSSAKSPHRTLRSGGRATSQQKPRRLLGVLNDSDEDDVQEPVVSSQSVDSERCVTTSRSTCLQDNTLKISTSATLQFNKEFVSVPEPPSPLLTEEFGDTCTFSPPERPTMVTSSQTTEQLNGMVAHEGVQHVPAATLLKLNSPDEIEAATLSKSNLPDKMEAGNSSQSMSLSQQSLKKAPCPVCDTLVPVRHIHAHLDRCLAKQSDQERTSRVETKRSSPEHRPKPRLVYTLLSDKALKRHLKDCGLNPTGSRQVLIRRHQEFTLRYNSECDAVNPKSAEQIVQEMEDEERARSSNRTFLSSFGTQPLRFESHQSNTDKDKLRERYAHSHSNHFHQLIEEIRNRPKRPKQTTCSPKCTAQTPKVSGTPSSQPKKKTHQRRAIVLSDEEDSSSEALAADVCDTTSSMKEELTEDSDGEHVADSPVWLDTSTTDLQGDDSVTQDQSTTKSSYAGQSGTSRKSVACSADGEETQYDGGDREISSCPVAELSHDDDVILPTSQRKRTPSGRGMSSNDSPGLKKTPVSTSRLKRRRHQLPVEESQLTDPDYAPSAEEMIRVIQQAEVAAYKRCLRSRKST